MPEVIFARHQTTIPYQWDGVFVRSQELDLNAVSYTLTSITEKLRQERDDALKVAKVLRDALGQAISAGEYVVDICEADTKAGVSPNPLECSMPHATLAHCYGAMAFLKPARKALAATTPPNLIVLSLEELKKWPCGCIYESECCSSNYEFRFNDDLSGGEYVCDHCGKETKLRVDLKCPRCTTIEKMDKGQVKV